MCRRAGGHKRSRDYRLGLGLNKGRSQDYKQCERKSYKKRTFHHRFLLYWAVAGINMTRTEIRTKLQMPRLLFLSSLVSIAVPPFLMVYEAKTEKSSKGIQGLPLKASYWPTFWKSSSSIQHPRRLEVRLLRLIGDRWKPVI